MSNMSSLKSEFENWYQKLSFITKLYQPTNVYVYVFGVGTHFDNNIYCQVSNIRHTLVGNKIVDHPDVVGASPVGAAPTTSSFSTWHLASMDWTKTTTRRDEKHLC